MVMQTHDGGNDEPQKQPDDPAITHTATVKFHPYADLFPMCSDEVIQQLAEDIGKNGQRQLIIIDDDEMIIDGRHRFLACEIAGVVPVYESFVGTDSEKLAYVVSANIHRRHLTTTERAEIAATIATMKPGDNQHSGKKKKEGGSNDPPSKPVSTKKAAAMMNVSTSSVKRAKAAKTPEPKADATPAAPKTASDWKMQRSRAKKTAEALQRALSDLNDLKRIQQLPDSLSCIRAIIGQLDAMNGDSPAAPNTSSASIVLDALDREIPAKFRAAHELGITLMSIGRELDKYRQRAKELSEQPGGEWLQMQMIDSEVRGLKARFQDAIYHTVCTQCAGKGCQKCQQNGWLPDFMKGMIN
jgi:hypothetical protein